MSSQHSQPQPASLANLEQASRDIPRYLYRVYSVKLTDFNGYNSDSSFRSAVVQNHDCHPSLSAMPYDVAQANLRKHLAWTKFSNSEFISWTSSLLWALQFAVRKTRSSTEHELRVCVLDTSRFNTSTFFPAPRLIQEFDLSASSDVVHEYHTTTYLAHGSLNVRNCSSTMSLACLRDNGLFDLMPALDDESSKQRLFSRVQDLRQTIVSATIPLSPAMCQDAFQVASSFDPEWWMPMMLAFLALRGLPLDAEVLVRFIRELAEPRRNFLDPLPPYVGNYIDAPELANFTLMMNLEFADMEKVRLRENDGLGHLDAGIHGLGIATDEVADTGSDASGTTLAGDPSPSTIRMTTTRDARQITAVVVLQTFSGTSTVTVRVLGMNEWRSGLPTVTIVGEEHEVRLSADSMPSTTIASGSGWHVAVILRFSEVEAGEGDVETEELS